MTANNLMKFSGAIMLGVLSACTLEPRYRAPALPVPNQWPIPSTTAADAAPGMAVQDIGWRDFFADTRLQQLIAQALANNRDLRVSILNIELARAQYRVQRANLLPTIDATGSFTKEKLPPALIFGPTSATEQVYQAGIGITSFEIDLFGHTRSLTHAAFQQYLAQGEARRSAQLSQEPGSVIRIDSKAARHGRGLRPRSGAGAHHGAIGPRRCSTL
jgi:multidrug efflux system outer membrane protein